MKWLLKMLELNVSHIMILLTISLLHVNVKMVENKMTPSTTAKVQPSGALFFGT